MSLGRRKKRGLPPLTGVVLRSMFGDALKGIWMPGQPLGGVIPDLSGAGHDGTPNAVGQSSRSLAPGIIGPYGTFDGSTSYISASVPYLSGARTVLVWRYVDDLASVQALANQRTSTDGWGWTIQTDGSVESSHTGVAASVLDSPAGTVEPGRGYMLGWTFDPSAGHVQYAQGQPVAANADTTASTSAGATFAIGASQLSGGWSNFSGGGVELVVLLDRAASADEIALLADLSGVVDAPAYYQPGYVSARPGPVVRSLTPPLCVSCAAEPEGRLTVGSGVATQTNIGDQWGASGITPYSVATSNQLEWRGRYGGYRGAGDDGAIFQMPAGLRSLNPAYMGWAGTIDALPGSGAVVLAGLRTDTGGYPYIVIDIVSDGRLRARYNDGTTTFAALSASGYVTAGDFVSPVVTTDASNLYLWDAGALVDSTAISASQTESQLLGVMNLPYGAASPTLSLQATATMYGAVYDAVALTTQQGGDLSAELEARWS